jgi:methylthioribose-1-phosphate isomerase
MIDESAAVLPIWMLISAAFGFMVGEALGGQARVRKYLEQANDDLREQLQAVRPGPSNLQQELAQQRHVINDIHKRIAAVTKGLQKPTS